MVGNSYFQFKQFIIHQENCAMKVTTDACILGAVTLIPDNATYVLDVGTGTGLLALMMAQKCNHIIIDAIEKEEKAVLQAQQNILLSSWHQRIMVIKGDATAYLFKNKYDLIIINPPFFNNSLLGPYNERNEARHAFTLTQQAILEIFENNLVDNGIITILLSLPEFIVFEKYANFMGWFFYKKLYIKHNSYAEPRRIVGWMHKKKKEDAVCETLIIYDLPNKYTQAFTLLLEPYYLNL